MIVNLGNTQKRYLPVKFANGLRLDIEEPTLQILAELEIVPETGKVKDLIAATTSILNRNKQHKRLKREDVAAMMTIDDMGYFMEAYQQFCLPEKN